MTIDRRQRPHLPVVSVGGTAGIASMAVARNTARLRATGRAGLYTHALGAEVLLTAGLTRRVARVFRGTGAGIAELGIPASRDEAIGFFEGPYRALYLRHGLAPCMANVNGLDPTGTSGGVGQWRDYASVAARFGLLSLAPFVNNNNPAWPDDFDHPFWDHTKQVALAMGAGALDTPPGFAFSSGPDYLGNVIQVIRWCRARKLRTSVVLSPHGDQRSYRASAIRFYLFLRANAALPTEWVVETFDDPWRPTHPRNRIASETLRNSTLNVALWMARHARVAPSPRRILRLVARSRYRPGLAR